MTANLSRLMASTADDRMTFARFMGDDRYVVLNYKGREGFISLKASAGRQIESPLSAEAQQMIYDAGLRRSRASDDYEKQFDADAVDIVALGQLVENIFENSFEQTCPEADYLEVPRFMAENVLVKEAMVHLVKNRDWAARKTLYRQLIDAEFAVPYSEGEEFLTIDQIASWRVAGVFLDEAALLKAYPLGQEYRRHIGRSFFPSVCEERIGAVRINPGSAPRGELYRNELEMIRQAIEKLSKHYGWSE